jgi:hypothetical protein
MRGLSSISHENRTLTTASKVVHEEDYISIDGNTGDVYIGNVAISREPARSRNCQELGGKKDEGRRFRKLDYASVSRHVSIP